MSEETAWTGEAVGRIVNEFNASSPSEAVIGGVEHPVVWRWIAVDAESGHAPRALLTASAIVTRRPYHDPGGRVVWHDCTLREWLNGDFLSLAMSEAQRGRIVLSAIDNSNSPMYGTNGGPATEDHIFLLSIDEVEDYLVDRDDRVVRYLGEPMWWWLRSPGGHTINAATVDGDGGVIENGFYAGGGSVGVVPALWLDLAGAPLTPASEAKE
jgi:hypothetical protein